MGWEQSGCLALPLRNMKKTVYLLDHRFIPTPYNQRFLIEKIASGFVRHGFDVKVIKKIDEIVNPGFVLVSHHDVFYNSIWGIRLLRADITRFLRPAKLLRSREVFSGVAYSDGVLGIVAEWMQALVLKKLSKKKDIIVIHWISCLQYWLEKFSMPYLASGEHYRIEIPKNSYLWEWYNFYKTDRRAIPYPLSASVFPGDVGKDCQNEQYDVCYVGNKNYQPDYQALFIGNPRARIVGTPPYIAEEERMRVYKNSKIALGLSYWESIATGMVTDRIVEALAYGAICLSNNPYAPGATDGCAIYVRNKEELLERFNYFVNNTNERHALREKGFAFIREKGTSYHRAAEFIERAKELYQPKFLQ